MNMGLLKVPNRDTSIEAVENVKILKNSQPRNPPCEPKISSKTVS
jgi:hypothetical protein